MAPPEIPLNLITSVDDSPLATMKALYKYYNTQEDDTSTLAMMYNLKRRCVVFLEVKMLPCEEQEILDIYVLLKQIEYYFEKSNEDSCSFGIEV
jgi:hypothetical protein